MKVHFKFPRSIDGTHYTPGVHELPDALSDHPFVKGLAAVNDLSFLDSPSASVESMDAPVEPKEVPANVAAVEDEPKKPSPQPQQRRKK
jgi:hypothetical protein